MKRNYLRILITLLLVILAVILLFNNRKGTLRSKENDFAVSDTSNITRFFFADKQNRTVKIERMEDGSWRLNDKYEAGMDAVNTMLKTFISIDIKTPLAKAARNNIIRLLSAKSVKVEIYQRVYRIDLFGRIRLFPHEKRTKTYYVGDATQDNMGTYMLMEGSEEPYVLYIPGLRGFVATRYSTREADWRSHSIFNSRLSDIRQISIEYSQTPEHSFSILNNGNRNFVVTSLLTSKPLDWFDTLKVINYFGSYRKINFEVVVSDLPTVKYDSVTSVTPTFVITLITQSGEKKVLKAWRRKAPEGDIDVEGNPIEWDRDRMYARIEGTNELVVIQYYVFDPILRPLSWFTEPSV